MSIVSRLFWPCAAIAYYVLACLMHLEVSLWLVRTRVHDGQPYAFADFVPYVATTLALVAIVALVRTGLQRSDRRAWFICWFGWGVCVVLIDRILTFSLNELAHYPQYAMMAWLLGRNLDPGKAEGRFAQIIALTTLLGVGDELLQYLWITTTYSMYLDFNDFVVNLVAAYAGALVYYARLPVVPARASDGVGRSGVFAYGVLAVVAVLCLLVAFDSGRIRLTPEQAVPPGGIVRNVDGSHTLYLQRQAGQYGARFPGPRHGDYWVLDPLTGLLLLGAGLIASIATGRKLMLETARVGEQAPSPVDRDKHSA